MVAENKKMINWVYKKLAYTFVTQTVVAEWCWYELVS